MASCKSLTTIVSRVSTSCAGSAWAPTSALAHLTDACLPSCSPRGYATQGDDQHGGGRRTRRPMRYGSKLAIRDPERFRRMRAILGFPDDASVGKVDRVTISTLQTMKYLMNAGDEKTQQLLEDMAAYKVTTLNRELVPLLDRTQAFLDAKPAAAAAPPAGAAAGHAAKK